MLCTVVCPSDPYLTLSVLVYRSISILLGRALPSSPLLSSLQNTAEYSKMTSWEQLAADKRARLDKTIPPEWRIQTLPSGDSVLDYPAQSGILSPKELEITGTAATELVAKLTTGELKSVEVTLAFCKRAALAHQLVCLSPSSCEDYFHC